MSAQRAIKTNLMNVSKVGSNILHRLASVFVSFSAQRPPQFDAWIDMYGGEEFEKMVVDYIDLVENACLAVDEGTRQEMKKHFVMSCKLEHMFWDQALVRKTWPEALSNVSELVN